MAKIKIVREEVKPVQPPIKEVILTLSLKEARVLRSILDFVGGSPSQSDRCFSDQIYDTLVSNNIRPSSKLKCSDAGLYFIDNNKKEEKGKWD